MQLRVIKHLLPWFPLEGQSDQRRVRWHESCTGIDIEIVRGKSCGVDYARRWAYEDIWTW
jgi:hypothetical protein